MHEIIIVQMINYEDNTRIQNEVAHLFHETFLDLSPTSQETIEK